MFSYYLCVHNAFYFFYKCRGFASPGKFYGESYLTFFVDAVLFLDLWRGKGQIRLINYSYVHLFCLYGGIELGRDKNADVATCARSGVVPCGAL